MSDVITGTIATTPRGRAVAVRTFIIRLAGAVRMARLHEAGNQALHAAVDDVVARGAAVLDELGPLAISIERSVLRVNGSALADLMRAGTPQELLQLRDEFESRGITALHLVDTPTRNQVLLFLDGWLATEDDRSPDRLRGWLHEQQVASLQVAGQTAATDEVWDEPADLQPTDVLDAYLSLLAVAEQISDVSVPLDGRLLARTQAAVGTVAVMTQAAPELLLFATTYRNHQAYDPVHASNTATLAMLLARNLGLGDEAVAELGQAALLCDVGMRGLSADVRSGGELDAYTTGEVLEHPLRSFLWGLRLGRMDPAHRAQLAVAWEHHTGVDGEGYPRPAPGGLPHVYARIVSICDAYDALVHDRGDRAGLARPLALEAMHQEAGRRFDREILYAFFEMMGRFPPGSVVRLQHGHIGIVATPAEDPRLFDRPEVILVREPDGNALPEAVSVDLAQQRGERSDRIVSVLDDRRFPETLLQYVF